MLKCLEDSESTNVSTRELEEQLLSQTSQGSISCASQGKPGTSREKSCFKSSGKEKVRSPSLVRRRPGGVGKAMSVLQGGCGISMRKTRSKKDMQWTAPEDCQRKHYEELKELEEQRAKEALVLVQQKHKLKKWEGEREKARTMQRLDVTRTMSPWSGGHDRSSSLAPKHR